MTQEWEHLTQGAIREAATTAAIAAIRAGVKARRDARRRWFHEQPIVAVISEPMTGRKRTNQ